MFHSPFYSKVFFAASYLFYFSMIGAIERSTKLSQLDHVGMK